MTLLDSLSLTNWLPIGPAPIGAPGVGLGFAAGRIEAAAADPGNGNVVYVAANNGGIWKTYDWNSDTPTWSPLGDAEESLDFSGYHPLVVHPADHNLILAVVSGPSPGGHGAGLLKSTNGGATWQLLGNALFEGAVIGSLAVDPTDTSVLYASVWKGGPGGGVYKSTDGGQNWTNTTLLHPGAVSDVIVARFDAQTLFAGLVGPASNGVYKSTHGGDAATPGTPEPRSWHLLLAVDPKNDNHVLVNDAYALYETKDGGTSWTRADTIGDGSKSIGDDWVNAGFSANGIALITADRNVYHYASNQKTWESKQGTLQVTLFYDVTPDPLDLNVAYGVSQDHPAALKFDGTDEWAYMSAGWEMGKVLVDPSGTDRLYVSNPLNPVNFVARSANGGQMWKTIFKATDFDANDYPFAGSTQRSFAMDPSDPARLVIGTTQVWETTDATAANPTWTGISGVLGGATASQQYVTALAIAPSAPKTIYAATADGHLWATTNGGASWKKRDTGLFGTGAGKIVDIRIDPSAPGRAFAVGAGKGSVWYLHKVGRSLQWKNISGDLPPYLRVGTIFVDWAYATPALYLGTTRGVYHSVDLGSHWSPFGFDMPNTLVTDLQSTSGDVLFAGTFGRGAWAILLKPSFIFGNFVAGPGHVDPWEPIEGARVVLESSGGTGVEVLATVTDRRGRYVFENVPPGAYRIRRIAPPGYVPLGRAQEQIAAYGSDIRGLDFRYRFDPGLAQEAEPYLYTADLTALPGHAPGQPVGAEDEFTRGS